ncbi:MAG TPA: hypothetical protein VF092_10420 [Longimicrobium sp.]
MKRLLRDQAARAYDEELRRALVPLANHFDDWRQGGINSAELVELIEKFDRGPARRIWARYYDSDLVMSVAYAVHIGILDRETVPAEALDALRRALEFYAEQDRRQGWPAV